MLEFIAELDPIIPRHLTEELCWRYEKCEVRYFWGTHYVPRDAVSIRFVTRFVMESLSTDTQNDWIDINEDE